MDMREISTRQPILGRQLGINYWSSCLSFWKTITLLSKWSLGTLFHTRDNVIDNRPPKLNQKILEKLDTLINNIDQYQYMPQNLHEVSEFGKLLRRFFGTAEKVTNSILNKKQIWRFILRNPKLSIRTLYCFTCHKYYLFYINNFLLKSFIVLILFFTIYFYNFFHFLYIW